MSVFITGDKELDALLRRLPNKVQIKAVKKATRNLAKKLKPKIVALTPEDQGDMRRAYQVRASNRKYKQPTGKIRGGVNKTTGFTYTFPVQKIVARSYGAKVEITRDSLNKVRTTAGAEPIGAGDYFYPASVELGTQRETAQMPMRTATDQMRDDVGREMQIELAAVINAEAAKR